MFEITEKNPEISGVFAWMQLSFRRVIFIPTAVHIGVFDAPLLEADGHDKRIQSQSQDRKKGPFQQGKP